MPTFLTNIQDEINEVENQMRRQVVGLHPDIVDAVELVLLSGGKRIRPTITLLTTGLIGVSLSAGLTIATAIELLHTATLIHDDLIDGALLRRGNPTLNSHWSPAATVLTGDLVFAKAAKTAAEVNSVEVMDLFTQTLVTIVNGEINQMFSGRSTVDRDSYFKRIYAKTASLFETAAVSPSLLIDNKGAVQNHLRQFGYSLGMAFQVMDDILDFTGEQATLGKPTGSDLHQGIVTLPTILYFEDHPDDSRLKKLQENKCNGSVDGLIEAIRSSDSISKAHQIAWEYVGQAINALSWLPDVPERQALESLAEYIVSR